MFFTKEKIKKATFLFLFAFTFIALSERFIGKARTYSKPLHWDEVYTSVPEYLIFAFIISLVYLYIERRK